MKSLVEWNRDRLIDITGQRFGKLVVSCLVRRGGKGKRPLWLCNCDCGGKTATHADLLKRGSTTSCGCVHRKQLSDRNRTHGKSRTPEYTAWINIKARCTNPNIGKHWMSYGGRGIKVCSGWSGSFDNFLEDVGERPSKSHSMDRIDVDGHYSCGKCEECAANGWKSNCRWATTKEQARNTRANRSLTANGKTMCIADWAEETGIPQHVIFGRLDVCGWDEQRTVTEPVNKQTPMKSISAGFSTKKEMYDTAEYRALHAAKGRCFNKNNNRFPAYGGRGITVCERWLEPVSGFFNFVSDVGNRPGPKHSLDRIDVNGNYSCGKCAQCLANGWKANCRWATAKEQANNKQRHTLP